MFSRFKKIGQGIQKATKSVEHGLDKASKSMNKSIDKTSKSQDASTAAATRSEGQSQAPPPPDTATTPTPAAQTPTASVTSDAAAVTPHDKASRAGDATPPARSQGVSGASPAAVPAGSTPVPRASSGHASEIEFNLDSDDGAAPPAPPPPEAPAAAAPSPPRGAPPKVPRRHADDARPLPDAVVPPKASAPASLRNSQNVTPAESHLSVHASDAGASAGGAHKPASSGVLSDNTSSIRFDMDTTDGSALVGGKGGVTKRRAGTPVVQQTSSIDFGILPADEEDEGNLAAVKDAASPLVRQNTASAGSEADEINFQLDDDDEDDNNGGIDVVGEDADAGESAVAASAPASAREMDVPATPSAATGTARNESRRASSATRDASRRRKVKKATVVSDDHEAGGNIGGEGVETASNTEAAQESQKRTRSRSHRRRSSSADKKHTDGVPEEAVTDAHSSRRRRARQSPSAESAKEVEGSKKPRRRHRKSLSPSSQDERSPSTSSAAASSQSVRRPTERVRQDRRPSARTNSRRASEIGAGHQQRTSTSRGRGSGADSATEKRRSSTGARTPRDVPSDVQRIFEQCRLDAKDLAAPRGQRRPVSVGPRSRSRSSFRSARDGAKMDAGYDSEGLRDHSVPRRRSTSSHVWAGRGDTQDQRSFHRDRASGSAALHADTPRGKYSGVGHSARGRRGSSMGFREGYGAADVATGGYSSESSVGTYVSYDSRQRELYRGTPRSSRRRVSSPSLVESPLSRRRRQRHASPTDWRQYDLEENDALVSPARTASPWRRQRSSSLASQRSPAKYAVESSPVKRRSQYAPPTPVELSVVRHQVTGSQDNSGVDPSLEKTLVDEEQLLEEVEYKLEVLAEQIAYHDFALERDMMSSPFERLYHMNNRRDRNERRELLARFNKLQAIREKIVTGALDREIAEREERKRVMEEKIRDPEGIYMRLYKSPRRRGAELEAALNGVDSRNTNGDNSFRSNGRSSVRARGGSGGGGKVADGTSAASSSRGASPSAATTQSHTPRRHRSGSRTKADQEAYFNRVYSNAVAGMRRRQELSEEAKKEKAAREYEDFLAARLAGRMQREALKKSTKQRPTRSLSPEEILAKARAKIEAEKRKGNEGKLSKDLLHGHRISRAEQERMANRLTKHGLRSQAQLDAKREELEKQDCTFKPSINEYRPRGYASTSHNRTRNDSSSGSGVSEQDSYGRSDDEGTDSERVTKTNRFDLLYRQGMEAKQRAADVQAQKDRDLRLKILKSRLSEDHHFRKRVELDPTLAERFMRSLEV